MRSSPIRRTIYSTILVTLTTVPCHAFTSLTPPKATFHPICDPSPTILSASGRGRSSPTYTQSTRSKRQERVGHMVRAELASILQMGHPIKGDYDPIPDSLRRKISIINADVSPDLAQARITVSIMGSLDDSGAAMMEKRKAYSWLVQNTKFVRYELAQRMKHMKSVPNLSFVQADVGAAVDVMNLIDKISKDKGYKRESLDMDDYEDVEGFYEGIDFDDEGEDDGWVDEDEDDEFLVDDEEE